MMRIGRLRTRLDLLTPQDVPDGAGGMRRSYAVKAAIWASIRPVRAGPDTTQDREGGSLTHRITVRRRDDVDAKARFRKGERLFQVIAVHDPDERGRVLECLCREAAR